VSFTASTLHVKCAALPIQDPDAIEESDLLRLLAGPVVLSGRVVTGIFQRMMLLFRACAWNCMPYHCRVLIAILTPRSCYFLLVLSPIDDCTWTIDSSSTRSTSAHYLTITLAKATSGAAWNSLLLLE
jgi:hypothetical protein